MTIPKINSAHGSDTRNIINRAIDLINVQGKSIQDLVAKGQLTPTQYATLIQTVNGLISKGNVTFDDIDINQGKLLPRHLSEEVLRMVTGDAPINAVPAAFSLTTDKYATQSVTPSKTTFFELSNNLFDAETISGNTILDDNTGNLIATDEFWSSDYIEMVEGQKYIITYVSRIVYYDGERTYSSGNRNSGSNMTFTAPINGFFRFSTHVDFKPVVHQVKKGTTLGGYEPYSTKIKDSFINKDVNGDNIEIGSVSPEKTTFFEISKNKLNPDTTERGFYLSQLNGDEIQLEGYATSDYIEMKRGIPVSIKTAFTVIQYGSDKQFMSGVRKESNMAHTFTPEYDGFFRVSFNYGVTAILDNQVEYNSTVTTFEPYYVRLKKDLVGDNDNDKFLGKVLLNFGDSIASAQTEGIDGYHEIIAEKYGMRVSNYARNGAKVTVLPGETNHLKTQIESAVAENVKPDYVLFDGLRNDVMNDIATFGEVTPGYDDVLDLGTFCGAFEYYCKTMRENWLGAKIIFIRTHNTRTVSYARQKQLGELAVEICEKYSIPVVDIWREGSLNTQFSGMVGPYTLTDTDATHPNTAGYEKFYVPLIESKMKSI